MACIPGVATDVAAGVLSTATMWYFQWRLGLTVLTGAPHGRYFQMWVGVIPFVLATILLAAIWVRTVTRCERADRLSVACLAAALLGCLWCAANFWIIYNGEIAFP